MELIAFDLGSTGAYSIFRDGKLRLVFTYKLTEDRVNRAVQFRRLLDDTVMCFKPEVVVYERPFARGQDATRSLWGLAGILEAFAGERAAVLDQVPSAIKLWATGKGNATKEMMIAAAIERGYSPHNDHEADAILLGLYTLGNMEKSG